MELINKYIKELRLLCERFHVDELYVFGSAASGKFTEISDIDFLVLFSGVNPIDYFDNYMNFKNELKNMYSRDIDLVEMQTIKNPILKNSIDRDKIRLYGRKDSKMAV